MKIVHVTGYFVPELGYQEYYLAKKHAQMGHDVHVITSDFFYPFPNIESMLKEAGIKDTSRKRKAGFSTVDGIKVHRLKSFFEYSDFILCTGLKEALMKINPDVVFSHESRQGLTTLAARYKKLLGYRLVVDQHDFPHEIPTHPILKKFLREIDYKLFRKFVVNYSLKRADKIIAVTEETKKFLINEHKISPKRLTMVPLGVDTDFFSFDKKSRESTRKKYGIGPGEILFTFSGTIVRRKGLELLLDAFSEINDANSKLMIVGGGDKGYVDELKKIASRQNIGNRIIFTGFVKKEEVKSYFSASDAAVWPGNNSVSIIEAMACRLPVIIADMQLAHLTDFENGIKFPEHDKQKLIS